ncbi:MAG: PadR family transcriptional regulator [Candidatus Omnitrophica bacterium]|nr:PadR family transcriptional regulator [Candidatus Omnitrophota bacterium]
MIEKELLLLGLLKESPKHGYDIKRKIKEILSLFAGVDLKSIYYPLQILERDGLVIKRITKPGNRPERIVYELTSKGESYFDDLLNRSFLNFKRPQFSLDLSLYFLHFMKPAVAKRRMRARLSILNRVSKGLEQMIKEQSKKKPSSLARILEHNRCQVQAESDFLIDLIKSV